MKRLVEKQDFQRAGDFLTGNSANRTNVFALPPPVATPGQDMKPTSDSHPLQRFHVLRRAARPRCEFKHRPGAV
jgi:hypothetical protein